MSKGHCACVTGFVFAFAAVASFSAAALPASPPSRSAGSPRPAHTK